MQELGGDRGIAMHIPLYSKQDMEHTLYQSPEDILYNLG